MLVVLDTNVLVSSLLKHDSKPAAILNSILAGKLQIAIDARIFDEYTGVLRRPRLGLPADQVDAILRFIAFSALWVQSPVPDFRLELIPDPGDLPFAEVAIHSCAEVLITGNKKHFAFLSTTGVRVLQPDEFLAEYPHYRG